MNQINFIKNDHKSQDPELIGSNYRMHSAQIVSPGSVVLKNVLLPKIAATEILIKLDGCGVCGSNLALWEGRPWFSYPLETGAPGHEGWGRVCAIGEDVTKFKIGDRVSVLSFHAFAQYDKADENNAVLLPQTLNDIPFPGEALGCAMNVFKRSQIKSGENVAIVGIGFLGALLCQLASRAGANVFAISRRNFALDMARKCGAEFSCSLGEIDETVKLVNIAFKNGCDCVIEATGYQHPLNVAGALVKIRGRLIIAGYHQDGLRQINLQQWNWKGIDICNAHERDSKCYITGMKEAVEAISKKLITPEILYSDLIPMDRIHEAFEAMKNRSDGFMKALVKI